MYTDQMFQLAAHDILRPMLAPSSIRKGHVFQQLQTPAAYCKPRLIALNYSTVLEVTASATQRGRLVHHAQSQQELGWRRF